MKAIVYQGKGDASVIQIKEVPSPALKPGQLKLRVRASGVNRADLGQRQGSYPPPAGESETPGLEAAGEVVEVPAQAKEFRRGDRVMALLAGGGYAQEVCVSESLVLPLPERLSFQEGAGIMEAFITAHHNVFHLGGAGPGSKVLIHAGASGVGTAALQCLRESTAKAFATVGSEEKARFCASLGAAPIEYRKRAFADVVLEQTAGQGVDVILDCIGADYWEANLKCLATDGALVVIGLMGGKEAAIDLGKLLSRRHRVVGSTLRALPLERKAAAVARFRSAFYAALAEGRIKPVIDSAFPYSQAKEAQLRMERNANTGKIVLLWD